MQIHLACPQTLLPVLPLLAQELQAEEESRRLEAVDLLGQLFMLPGSDMDLEYGYLFEELMRRCKDQKVGCRAKGVYALHKQCAVSSVWSHESLLVVFYSAMTSFLPITPALGPELAATL